MKVTKTIDSGTLTLQVDEMNAGYTDINEILGFASRMNAKRGFLFVSTILGKHIPVAPSVMRQSYDRMAEMVGQSESKTLVVGMSETATGMGGGIADSLARINLDREVYFQHTTRHELNKEQWFQLDEDHSHAVSHIVYEPLDALKDSIVDCTRLVLADDEISTGKTLLRLAKGYMKKLNHVEVIDIVALVSWLDDDKTEWFMSEITAFCKENNMVVPTVNFEHLMRGSFTFDKNPDYNADLPAGTDKGLANEISYKTWGRCGVKMPVDITEADWLPHFKSGEKKIAIIGTGEHLFKPFLIAEAIEKTGKSVLFQSTTRSPVFQDGEVITSIDELPLQRKDQDPVQHYIYNLDRKNHVEVICESEQASNWYKSLTFNNLENVA